jgi:hypothetical protein
MRASKRWVKVTGDALRPFGPQIFARIGLFLLGLDLVFLGLVGLVLWWDGAGQVPGVLLGGAVDDGWFMLDKWRQRDRILAGDDSSDWASEAGPRLREDLLRAYRPSAPVFLTLPYFLVVGAYGLLALPWRPPTNWDELSAGVLVSSVAVVGLTNGMEKLYFSWLARRIVECPA